jgi:hypothetical protein
MDESGTSNTEECARLASRRLTAPAPRRGKEAASAVFRLNRLGELRRYVSELGVGPPYCPQAPALADPIEFGDGLVESMPKVLRTTATGCGLQLVRRLRATARRRPLEPVLVGRLAGLRPLTRSRRRARETGAEARVGRREHVVPQGGSPRVASLLESPFRFRAHPPSNRPFGSASDRVDVVRRSGSAAASRSNSHGSRAAIRPNRRATVLSVRERSRCS